MLRFAHVSRSLRTSVPVRSCLRVVCTSSSVNNSVSVIAPPAPSGAPAGAVSKRCKPPSLPRLYAELSKARLSSLVVFTSGAGFLMAGAPPSLTALAAATIGTSLAAASAGTFNQLYEIKTDAKMMRTHTRPLPSGNVSALHAGLFGAATLAAGSMTLALGTNELTTLLGIGNVALYSLIYTPLKQHSELNTAVGAIVGAIPPLMGWAAATGGLLAWEPILLGLGLFWWQFPHFYSLGWTLRKDYTRGGYAMVPCFDGTGKRTAWLSLRSTIALSMLPFAAVALGVTTPMFAVEGAVLNGYLLRLAYKFYQNPNDASARALFRCSLWYLPLLLLFMVFHSVNWKKADKTDYNATSVQSLLERGMQELHEVGRAACIHEIFVREKLANSTARIKAIVGAICGTTTASNAIVNPADKDAGASGGVVQDTRMQCPVVVVEEAAKAVMPANITIDLETNTSAKAAAGATSTT